MSLPYPHVVIRFMSCVYGSRPVRWGGGPVSPNRDLHVPIPPPDDPERLEPEEREAVLRAAWREVRATGFQRCVVFGPTDVVYVKANGDRVVAPPPSGGVRA